ncbi:MAG: hypothetical protein PHU06_06310 [Gallionella sp.]|nr:hypothetical protein [Gallionella sp.]MDD4958421.1 hypothetical protein [Gallionella sp.]
MALIDDPKVQALVDKSAATATKTAEQAAKDKHRSLKARLTEDLNGVLASLKDNGAEKAVVKLVKEIRDQVLAAVKEHT